jgi:hypothetical protein
MNRNDAVPLTYVYDGPDRCMNLLGTLSGTDFWLNDSAGPL